MARDAGRPMAALVLSGEEQSFLKRQVRQRGVARSLSERVLDCQGGGTIGSKVKGKAADRLPFPRTVFGSCYCCLWAPKEPVRPLSLRASSLYMDVPNTPPTPVG